MTKSQVFLNLIQQLKIRTSTPSVIPFTFNKPQQMIWSKIAPLLDEKKRVWLIILKARREGVSTLAESLMFVWTATQPLVQSLVIAHDFDAAKKVWEMSQRFLADGPYRHIGKMHEHSIRFGDSILEVDTAASPHSRRGSDTTCLHASELAFWKHEEALLATIQTLPKPNIQSLCIIESTANGMVDAGEQFYNEWQRAVAGDSGFVPIFLSWLDFPDYRIAGATVEEPDHEERELVKVFGVTEAQLAWRRYAIADLCQGSLDRFHQEYPAVAEEAFVQSGLPFFSSRELLWIRQHIAKGKRYRVDPEGRLTEDPNGYLEVWGLPDPRHRYVIGADSSMGIEEVGNKARSRSAAEILCMETLEQVGEYDAVSAPHLMSRHLAGMGRLYNNAILCPEVTSSGGGGGREIIVYLKELNYYNIHVWRQPDHIQRGRGVMYGWETNTRTRPRMIARCREVIMEQSAVIHSEQLLKQLSAFGESDSGKLEALAGHDDLLFAWGIALMSRSENYFAPMVQGVSPPMPDFRSMGIRMQGGYEADRATAAHLQQVFRPRTPRSRHWLER